MQRAHSIIKNNAACTQALLKIMQHAHSIITNNAACTQTLLAIMHLRNPDQRRLDSRPQSIMGIERLIPRVTSLTVDCRGVNISLTKPIWKLRNDKSVGYFVKTACYFCIVAIIIMTCVLLYQVYLFLNCMGRAVILAL